MDLCAQEKAPLYVGGIEFLKSDTIAYFRVTDISGFSRYTKLEADIGQPSVIGQKKLKTIVGSNGKAHKFNSLIDAFNWFHLYGWVYQNTQRDYYSSSSYTEFYVFKRKDLY